jgi:hypothetical protein
VNANTRGGPRGIQDAPVDIGGKPVAHDDAINLSAYLACIGYAGPLRLKPDVLTKLIERAG